MKEGNYGMERTWPFVVAICGALVVGASLIAAAIITTADRNSPAFVKAAVPSATPDPPTPEPSATVAAATPTPLPPQPSATRAIPRVIVTVVVTATPRAVITVTPSDAFFNAALLALKIQRCKEAQDELTRQGASLAFYVQRPEQYPPHLIEAAHRDEGLAMQQVIATCTSDLPPSYPTPAP